MNTISTWQGTVANNRTLAMSKQLQRATNNMSATCLCIMGAMAVVTAANSRWQRPGQQACPAPSSGNATAGWWGGGHGCPSLAHLLALELKGELEDLAVCGAAEQ